MAVCSIEDSFRAWWASSYSGRSHARDMFVRNLALNASNKKRRLHDNEMGKRGEKNIYISRLRTIRGPSRLQ